MRKNKTDIVIDWNDLKTHEKKHISDYITQKAEGYNFHEYRLIFDENPKIHVLYHADKPNPPEGYKKAFIPVCELQKEETDRIIGIFLDHYGSITLEERQNMLDDFIANGSIMVIYKVKYAIFLFDEEAARREEDAHQDENESKEEEKERLNGFRSF